MSTPSHFYKNTAYDYAKEFDLSSTLENLETYNIATGSSLIPRVDASGRSTAGQVAQTRGGGVKRQRLNTGFDLKAEQDKSPAVALSHADYVQQRKHELLKPAGPGAGFRSPEGAAAATQSAADLSCAPPCQPGEEAEPSRVPTSQQGPSDGGDRYTSGGLLKRRSDQRFAHPGDPACVVCGRYGEYVCDETDEDVCSLECKDENLQMQAAAQAEETLSGPAEQNSAEVPPSAVVGLAAAGDLHPPDRWNYDKNRWEDRKSVLSTYRCWKCNRPGHLATDCTAPCAPPTASAASGGGAPARRPPGAGGSKGAVVAGRHKNSNKNLAKLYRRCREAGSASLAAKCTLCTQTANLAMCMDCSGIFCETAGHLAAHAAANPSHRQYYSYKLQRLIKCCKGSCPVTDVKELFACSYCFSKAFDKAYSMYKAVWKDSGLKIVCSSVCCDEHFDWHRVNCPCSAASDSGLDFGDRQLCEFLF